MNFILYMFSYSELPLDEEYVDVYLSAVITPNMFYVQRADELDR